MANIADTTAAPTVLTIGRLWWRKDLLIAPLTMGDMGWYARMGGGEGEMQFNDQLLMIWLSLRKYQPTLAWGKCRRLFGRFKTRRAHRAFKKVLALNPSALSVEQNEEPEDTGDKKGKKPFAGYMIILRSMAVNFQWTPDQTFSLTPEQANLLMAGDLSKSVTNIEFESHEEAVAYIAARKKRNAEDAARLEETRIYG